MEPDANDSFIYNSILQRAVGVERFRTENDASYYRTRMESFDRILHRCREYWGHPADYPVLLDQVERLIDQALNLLAEWHTASYTDDPEIDRPSSPDYYNRKGVDCADIINAYGQTDDTPMDYWSGSVVTHVLRAGRKPGESKLHALRNAQVCLEQLIAFEEELAAASLLTEAEE